MPAESPADARPTNWAAVYWVLAVNQWLALGWLAYAASAIMQRSLAISEDFDVELPAHVVQFFSIGPQGLRAVAALASLLILLLAFARRYRIALLLTTLCFLATVVFLALSMIASFVPLEIITNPLT